MRPPVPSFDEFQRLALPHLPRAGTPTKDEVCRNMAVELQSTAIRGHPDDTGYSWQFHTSPHRGAEITLQSATT